jgi:hypothetical protein
LGRDFVLRPNKKATTRLLVFLFLGTLTTPALFELWKLVVLGPAGYVHVFAETLRFARDQGVGGGGNPFERMDSFNKSFGISFAIVLVTEVVVLASAFWYKQSLISRRLILLIGAASIVHLCYWLFASVGWPRYALVGLVYYSALIGCIALTPRLLNGAAIGVLLLVLQFGHFEASRDIVRGAIQDGFGRSAHERALGATAQYAESLPKGSLASGWWGSAIDVEYALPTVGNFIRIDQPGLPSTVNLVVNSVLSTGPYDWPTLDTFVSKNCSALLFAEDTYKVMRCTTH